MVYKDVPPTPEGSPKGGISAGSWLHDAVADAWSKHSAKVDTSGGAPVDKATRGNQQNAPVAGSRDSAASETKPAPSGQRQQWTVAVDLTSTQHEKSGNRVVAEGGNAQMQRLKELAEKTKGKNVTIIAQDLVPAVGGSQITPGSGQYNLERYEIRDGKSRLLSSVASQGEAKDLQDLVHVASHDYPSGKLGLIVQSHGMGDQGIAGDSGGKLPQGSKASMGDVTSAIKNGLAGSERDKGSGGGKLDLLDLDACLMGNEEVLDKSKAIAKDMVASSELEYSSTFGEDGQNLKDAIKHLLNNPNMTGSKWADKFVEDARTGRNADTDKSPKNDDPDRTGTPTLAHYDLKHEDQLNQALNQLGTDLGQLAKDPKNRAVLLEAIQQTQRYAKLGDPDETMGLELRDLKPLLNHIGSAIGQLSGNKQQLDHLKSEIGAVSEAQSKVTKSFSGEHAGGYDKDSGMSVYVPGKDFEDVKAHAQRVTPIQNLLKNTEMQNLLQLESNTREGSMSPTELLQSLKGTMGSLKDMLAEDLGKHPGDMAQAKQILGHTFHDLLSSTTWDEAKQRTGALHTALLHLQDSKVGADDLGEAEKTVQQMLPYLLKKELSMQNPGWGEFLSELNKGETTP